MPLLEIRNISKSFGGLRALNNVTFELRAGEILGLIGPNGAGKTTLFNTISGFLRPDKGEIVLGNENISGLRPHEICFRGIARTFQLVKPFEDMNVLDNVMIGSFNRLSKRADAQHRSTEILEFTGLEQHTHKLGRELTIAHRKRLELARALATEPEILMLDEVMTGLTPSESLAAQNLARRIRDRGITILIIEHVMRAVMSLCDRIVVLHYGEVIAQGTPSQIGNNEDVIEAYLGRQAFA
jgi:branched-chain amino acid transport system ATP-binding protein